MDDAVAQFVSITDSSPQVAEQYLKLSDGNLEQAMQLFFDSGGLDLMEQQPATASSAAMPPTSNAPAQTSHPPRQGGGSRVPVNDDRLIQIDSDNEMDDDDDPQITGWRQREPSSAVPHASSQHPGHATPPHSRTLLDDEAIARRMQEELYAGHENLDGVRAPIARTTETLVGPGADWGDGDEDDLTAAVQAQMAARRLLPQGRPGIFNQRIPSASVWDESVPDPNSRRRVLSQATGGASEASSKASMLAEMYRPPVEIISRLPWDDARQEGKSSEKWILVNVQDPAVFDCQVLNRDIWKDVEIRETIKEHFIFIQYNKDDPRGNQYIQFYFKERDVQDAYPHIAIVDPRTGEQVKVWSGPPVPKAMDFLMQLHEFLDRFSLKLNAKNPIVARKAEDKNKSIDVDRMTEDQMLEMALQNSLATQAQPGDEGTGHATGEALDGGKGKGKAREDGSARAAQADEASHSNGSLHPPTSAASPFAAISSTNPPLEPAADPTTTTRIQFRHSGGRVIRRFSLTDPVRRLYEWLKAEPIEGTAGVEFALVNAGRNLIGQLDETIDQAGLRNQTVMIEFVED